MIQLNPLTQILLLEAIIIVGLVPLVWLWRAHHRQRKEHHTIGSLINRFKSVHNTHLQEMEKLKDLSTLTDAKRDALFNEITQQKQSLYRQILKLFLKRDLSVLTRVDEGIRALTDPYQQLLEAVAESENPDLTNKLENALKQIDRLQRETNQLAGQLQVALETIDNLSSEYTRMFAPDKTTHDIETSRRKILETLQSNENRLKKILPEENDMEDDLVITLTETQ